MRRAICWRRRPIWRSIRRSNTRSSCNSIAASPTAPDGSNLRCGDDYYRWQLPLAHTTDNLLYARECAIAGAGITLLPAFLSREVVAQKLLVEVLPAWRAEGNELYLVYPSRKLNSPALACFIDVVLQHPAFDDYARELARE